MFQRNQHDSIIKRIIQNETIDVDSHKGVVFGTRVDMEGIRSRIGSRDKDGNHLFNFKHKNKYFSIVI